ncbi:hypothetical protein OBCHQ24_15515 [Oceanobacillus iheyensis]|nr:hypothetical protein OBCHQ24_15515 [Oceanobacillus iheyensis]
MKVAISMIVTCDKRIDRKELVKEIQNRGHEVIYLGQESPKKIHPDYKINNINFISIPIGRDNTNPLNEIKSLLAARNTIKNNGIDVLIAYGIRTFPTVVLAAKLAGVKKIMCVVNGSGRLFQLQGLKGILVKTLSYPLLSLSFLTSNNILFQNPDDQKMIKRKGLLWKNNYDIINGSGVNIEEFKFNKLEKNLVFSMISRLTESKGVNEFVTAALKIKKTYPDTSFNLIGPIDDSTIDMKQLQKAMDKKVINLVGKVEDVRPYISNCRVFVLPSYYPEGIPRSILEAMAMGRPVITTDSTGCRETVIDGINGFLIPPKDPYTLEKKMLWMINNNEEVEKMGVNSRKLCEEKFDVNKINKIMINKLETM